MRKMPPSRLSKNAINTAREILMQLNSADTDQQRRELCNKYYTVIPHNFGFQLPPLITNVYPHSVKLAVLEDVMEAMRVLESARDNEPNMNRLDALLKKLDCDLVPEEIVVRPLIDQLAGPSGVNPTGKVLSAFAVKKHDNTAFAKHEGKDNRQLLWLACSSMAAVLLTLHSGAREYDRKYGKRGKTVILIPH